MRGFASSRGRFCFGEKLIVNADGDIETPRECKTCPRWGEIREKFRLSKLLARILEVAEDKLESQELKPSIGDYLKLIQMEQEVDQETAKEIKVTWIDPTVTSDTEE